MWESSVESSELTFLHSYTCEYTNVNCVLYVPKLSNTSCNKNVTKNSSISENMGTAQQNHESS